MQVIDACGDIASAVRLVPHCASVLGPAEVNLAPRLLARLAHSATQRLRPASAANAPTGTVLVLIDGWDVACAALSDVEAAAGTDELINLLRVAPTVGLVIAVSGDRGLLAPRFANGFAERLLLRLSDRHDAGMLGVRPDAVPGAPPPGRAVRATDGALVQLALPAASVDAVRAEVADTVLRWMGAVPGPSAVRVRPLPERVRLDELPVAPGRLVLGLAGDDPAPVFADPFAGPARWLVAGPPRSGRTMLLRLLAEQAHAAGIATLVAATERSTLLRAARNRGIPTLRPGSGVGPAPTRPTLVLVDDGETFTDTPVGAQLADWARDRDLPVALVAAGRADDLATSYRGVAAEVRRHRIGVLLRPAPLDGELFGIRLPRQGSAGPPGRGLALADSSWGPAFADGDAVPIQVATP
jgi:S-DNA-T family DNA segregation ATPase FtsK/SpoIIIE